MCDSLTTHRLRKEERGSALLLVPAGIVIVIMLGAMAVNASLSFMAERSVAATASEVANDIATLAIDEEHFRTTGEYRLVDDLTSIAEQRIAIAYASSDSGVVPGTMSIQIARPTPQTVEVTVTADVSLLVRLPSGDATRTVSASATASAFDT